jgi:predicted dehydrogenase
MAPTGFHESPADTRPAIGVGLLGYGFMGKAHSNAFATVRYVDWPGGTRPDLIAIAGRTEAKVRDAATRYGFRGYYTDWQQMVGDERLQVFDNVADDPAHVEPTLAAIAAGKHVVCEKPLAIEASDARRMWEAAERSKLKNLTCFNYRFVPAVRLARDMIRRGELGDVYQARFRYSQEWRHDPSAELPSPAGALRIIGCHAIDQARFLLGEIVAVSAAFASPVSTPDRLYQGRPIEPDDVFASLVQLENGAPATIDASLVSRGRRNYLAWEINCQHGTLAWNLEQLNELRVFGDRKSENTLEGLTDVIVCEPDHPFMDMWWPTGHIVGWEHSHINMLDHFLRCVADDKPVGPEGATFEDGYRAQVIAECMHRAADTRQRVEVPSS